MSKSSLSIPVTEVMCMCAHCGYKYAFAMCVHVYIAIYIAIYIYKEFCVGGSKAKTVLYFSYTTTRYEQALGLDANIALGFASCYISHLGLVPRALLSVCYIIHL